MPVIGITYGKDARLSRVYTSETGGFIQKGTQGRWNLFAEGDNGGKAKAVRTGLTQAQAMAAIRSESGLDKLPLAARQARAGLEFSYDYTSTLGGDTVSGPTWVSTQARHLNSGLDVSHALFKHEDGTWSVNRKWNTWQGLNTMGVATLPEGTTLAQAIARMKQIHKSMSPDWK